MKRIISLIALFFIFNSCSTDNGDSYLFELLPVTSVDMPAEFTVGGTYQITMHYKRPTSCHFFNGIYYDKKVDPETSKNIRTIAIENAVAQKSGCQTLTNNEVEYSFNFQATSTNPYIFKFWKGKDADGNNVFLEVEVPVN
ncbi:hypothetical protein EZL74_01865 [Flavobacterium silvisoli]|uniref:Proteinase inhibitor I42 chagasin domain-containing protein n=1 Tax=Flavobacterium silvisoli TaxID=2529433 RepID=A0A4Q9Z4A6_9FLAO|nr:hypothetical protein [Flavobacterium silvisoli]TBX71278.1 hypothetical protein EZL74_01865 [Flavobacterium silvisoli]